MREPRKDLTLAAILIVAIVDAILIGVLRARYMRSHGYEMAPQHRAAPTQAPR